MGCATQIFQSGAKYRTLAVLLFACFWLTGCGSSSSPNASSSGAITASSSTSSASSAASSNSTSSSSSSSSSGKTSSSSSSSSSGITSSSSSSSSSSGSSSSGNAATCTTPIVPAANTLRLLAKGVTCASLGYAEYVPANYSLHTKYPLIIALHGDTQSGTGSATDVLKLDDDGLPAAIAAGKWDAQKRFVVLAPQMNYLTRNAVELRNFIAFAKANYAIDPARIYLTAYSGGGGPFYNYMETYDGADIAAAAPISAVYSFTSDASEPCSYKSVPMWIFHGAADTTVNVYSNATAPFDGLKKCSPAAANTPKISIYTGVAHNAWGRTYDLSGLNTAVESGRDSYNQSIYDWFLGFTLSKTSTGSSSSSSSSSTSSSSSSSASSSSSSGASNSSSSSSSGAALTKDDPDFGQLTLVDSFDPTNPGLRETQSEPAGASSIQTLLGKAALVLTPQASMASYAAFRLGKNAGLVPGKAYVLEMDYPDDVPRTTILLNRGADITRTIATGKSIGDYREQYAYPNPESLAYPQTQKWLTARFYFYLHDRFQPLAAVRNEADTRRPFGPDDGFWVALGNPNPKGDPMNQGAALGAVRLYAVADNAAAALATQLPPANLPHRRTFWREEMNDSVAMCVRGDSTVNTDPNSPSYSASCNPATGTSPGTTTNSWLEYKMQLSKVLGFNVFTKDLLEFGHNQGMDMSAYGGDKLFYSARLAFWPDIVKKAGELGLEVLPYFEYYGSVGAGEFSTTNCPSEDATGNSFCATATSNNRYQCKKPWQQTQAKCFLPSYGSQLNCRPLTRANRYTPYSWAETACVDVTDPEALTDVKKLIGANILDLKDRAQFAGAWFRTRVGSWPINFNEAARDRYALDRHSSAPSLDQLRQTPSLLNDYRAWWQGKRLQYLTSIRDYIRSGTNAGVPGASVLFGSYHEEGLPIPTANYGDTRVITDDVPAWTVINADARWKYRYSPATPADWLSNQRFAKMLFTLNLPTDAQLAGTGSFDEMSHGTPPADPERYQHETGLYMTMPYDRQYTVADTGLLQQFTTAGGLALERHFALNEDDGTGDITKDQANSSFNNWPMSGHFGYYVSDMERSTPYTMLVEVRALATADVNWIAYLSSSSFNTAAPHDLRRFNAAYLAWPALPSTKVSSASPDSEVVVRDMVTSAGTFIAVFNTSMTPKTVTLDLFKTRLGLRAQVQNRVTGAVVATPGGQMAIELPVAGFSVFYLAN